MIEYVIKDWDLKELNAAVDNATTLEELKEAMKKLIWYLNCRQMPTIE